MKRSRRLQRIERTVADLPPEPGAIRGAFAWFRETGELPEDKRLGRAVIRWAETGVDPTQFSDDEDGRAAHVRELVNAWGSCPSDDLMKCLREEAVFATGTIRDLARALLMGMADRGEDPTENVLQKRGPPYPEWTCGSAAFSIIGWPYRWFAETHHERLRVVLAEYRGCGERLSQLPTEVQDDWFDEFYPHLVAHRETGALPENDLMRDTVLVDAEFRNLWREGMSEKAKQLLASEGM